MARIIVPLKGTEWEALTKLANRERRDPREQAALIVVRALEQAGLLPACDLGGHLIAEFPVDNRPLEAAHAGGD
jgi:hypothetical protein